MKTMTYQGYAARIEYSDDDASFVGHIASIRDVIGFHADTVAGCAQRSLRPWMTTLQPARNWNAPRKSRTPGN